MWQHRPPSLRVFVFARYQNLDAEYREKVWMFSMLELFQFHFILRTSMETSCLVTFIFMHDMEVSITTLLKNNVSPFVFPFRHSQRRFVLHFADSSEFMAKWKQIKKFIKAYRRYAIDSQAERNYKFKSTHERQQFKRHEERSARCITKWVFNNKCYWR